MTDGLTLYARYELARADLKVKAGFVGGEEIDSSVYYYDFVYFENYWLANLNGETKITIPIGSISSLYGSTEYSRKVSCDYSFRIGSIFARDGYKFVGFNVSTTDYDWSKSYDGFSPPRAFSFVPEIDGGTYYLSLIFERDEGGLKYTNGLETSATFHYGGIDQNGSIFMNSHEMFYEGYANEYYPSIDDVEYTLNFYLPTATDVTVSLYTSWAAETLFGLDGVYNSDRYEVLQDYPGSFDIMIQHKVKFANVSRGNHSISFQFSANSINSYQIPQVLFKIDADIDEGYFYFEDGIYPQSYVGDLINNELLAEAEANFDRDSDLGEAGFDAEDAMQYAYSGNGSWSTSSGSYSIVVGGEERYICEHYNYGLMIPSVAPKTFTTIVGGVQVTFVEGMVYWFKLEPIRWRVTPLGVRIDDVPEKFNTLTADTTFNVVSDKVLDFGRVNADGVVGSGWSYTDSDMFEAINANFSALRDTFKHAEEAEWRIDSISKSGESGGSTIGTNQKVVSTYNNSHTGLLQASVQDVDKLYQDNYSEIFASDAYYHNNTKLDESKRSAYASDLVLMLSGKAITRFAEWGTRDLYNNKNNFNIASAGYKKNVWLNGESGVRFAYAYEASRNSNILMTGQNFNRAIKRYFDSSAQYGTDNTNIKEIVFDYYDKEGHYYVDGVDISGRTGGSISFPSLTAVDVSQAQDGSIKAHFVNIAAATAEKPAEYAVYVLSEERIACQANSAYMFTYFKGVEKIRFDNFNTSKVTNMLRMFMNCVELTEVNVGGFDTRNVTSMELMFRDCHKLTALDVENFNVSKVTTMERMFQGCSGLEKLDLSAWDVGKVTTMRGMFYCSGQHAKQKDVNINVSGWNASKVIDMSYMFYNCGGFNNDDLTTKPATVTIDVTGMNTSNVTTMEAMFSHVGNRSVCKVYGIETLDVSKVTDMSYMFSHFSQQTQFSLNLSGWDVSSVQDMSRMFNNCYSMTSLDLTGWDASSVTTMASMFAYCERLTSLNVSHFVTDNVTDMSRMFHGCQRIANLDVSNFNTSGVTTMDGTFYNCRALTALDLSNFNTQNVTTMAQMFYQCHALRSLDLSSFDGSNSTSFRMMFWECKALADLTLPSNLVTSAATDLYQMFFHCEVLEEIDTTGWDFSGVESSVAMFHAAYALKRIVGIENWKTDSLTDTNYMFRGCDDLLELDLSGWDVSQVTDMHWMFYGCYGLQTLDVSTWDTSRVSNMERMFSECKALTELDISSFDTSNVSNMSYMFATCSALTTIYVGENWATDFVTSSTGMFAGSTKLVGGNGTKYSSSYVDKRYAMIDAEYAGYFTDINFKNAVVLAMGSELRQRMIQTLSMANIKKVVFDYYRDAQGNITTEEVYYVNGVNIISGSLGRDATPDGITGRAKIYVGNSRNDIYVLSAYSIYMNEFAYGLFNGFWELTSIEFNNFNTSRVVNMISMFEGCESLTNLNLTSFDTANVVDMAYMFFGCESLFKIYVSNAWTVENVVYSNGMFINCTSLSGGNGTRFSSSYVDDKTYAVIDKSGQVGYLTYRAY